MPRIRRTRVQRLLRALQQTSRYSLRSAMIALAGCTGLPHLVAVSPDGRYVVAPMNDRGVAIGQNSKLVLIDLETGKATALDGEFDEPMWLHTAGGVVTFMLEREVVILRDGQVQRIVDAGYPTLSRDGRLLVYSRAPVQDDQGKQVQPPQLMVLDLDNRSTTDLNVAGILSEFSPDGKRLAYVTQFTDGEKERMRIHIANADGGDAKTIAEFDELEAPLVAPRWVDAQHVLFQMKAPDTGDDTELYLADIDGQLHRLTDDDLNEFAPQPIDDSRIVYMKLPTSAPDKDTTTGPLWVAQRTNGKWEHHALDVAPISMATRGNHLVTIELEQKDDEVTSVRLMLRPLDDPQKATDLTQMVRDAGIALPAAK